jgi:hypothetical protein
MKQMIDFDKLFFDYFCSNKKKIFKVRKDVNLNHDIYFFRWVDT